MKYPIIIAVAVSFLSVLSTSILRAEESYAEFHASTLASVENLSVKDIVAVDSSQIDRSLQGGVVSYAESLKEARPAVVSVFSKSTGSLSKDELLLDLFRGQGRQPTPRDKAGSGVIVSSNGYIITNYHVISGADELEIELDGKRRFPATVVGTDPQSDIAIIKIEAEGLPSVVFADSDNIEVGDVVFAIGNPLGIGKTVTMGIVSATGRFQIIPTPDSFEDFIQTDAPINSGNSGGALVDAMGRLIGINTMIQTDGRSSGNIGIGFAVPANMAYSVMTDLIEYGEVSRGFLGVTIESLDEDKAEYFKVNSLKGALVNQVGPDSPASEAGVNVGDIIVSINGQEIDSPNDLKLTVSEIKPGTEIEIGVIRDGSAKTLSASLARRGENGIAAIPAKPVVDFLEGVTFSEITDDLRLKYELDEDIQGVVIIDVAENSPHANLLSEGMAVLRVNGQKVDTPAAAASSLKPAAKNMLHVAFRGVHRWISIEIE